MKTAKELMQYTFQNMGAMREWYNREYKHAQNIINDWIKLYNVGKKKDDEIVSDLSVYDLEGQVITYNYMVALLKCREEYTQDLVFDAVDLILQKMAEDLSEHLWMQYPCLRRTHDVVMRANRFNECIMYIGPYKRSDSACRIFGDGGVFMTQGMEACKPLIDKIQFFD